ncbi:hypothetical protein AVEN_124526-1 [Araneus ventricosus]|uniref:Uncharacterized protein n=1 Tax=Araneus ventricosus TaxID=182803 RepID=A0A4Y2WYX6_ARAVE|nr:hypothetical protein AVEN_124526-1 [Araneus ventricosus]
MVCTLGNSRLGDLEDPRLQHRPRTFINSNGSAGRLSHTGVQTSPTKAQARNQVQAHSPPSEIINAPQKRLHTSPLHQSQVLIPTTKSPTNNTGTQENINNPRPAQHPQRPVTYADKARGKPSKPQTILHYANEGSKEDNISNILRKERDIIKKIPIKDVRKIRNGIAIDCKSKEDIDAILQEIEGRPDLKAAVKPVQFRQVLPRCIVYGLPLEITKEELEESLHHNFPGSKSEELRVLFPIKGRTGKNHWVF